MVTNVEGAAVDAQGDEAPVADPRSRSRVTFAALVRGVDVELTGAAGLILAADDVHIARGGARSIIAGGGLELRQGGAGLIVAGGDASIAQGGAQAIVSAGSISMESAGSGFAIARRIRIGPRGLTIFSVTPKLEVQEGGRVVFGRVASAAVLGGVAAAVALVAVLVGRRRR